MIEHVDRALERFLREKTPLPESSVAVSFEVPDKAWGASRTRPTVNVFLFEMFRSPQLMRTGMERRVDESGKRQRRPDTPVVDLHYLLTAWASEPRDEHELLGSVLSCVLAHNRLPEECLSEPLADKRCRLQLAPFDMRPPGELWSALGGPRAAVQVLASIPFEVFAWRDEAPPAESVAAMVAALPSPDEVADESEAVITRRRIAGGVVMEGRRDPGSATTGS